jgi:hypothetical protein
MNIVKDMTISNCTPVTQVIQRRITPMTKMLETMNATTENNKEEIVMTNVNPMEKEMKELMKYKKAELVDMILTMLNEAADLKVELVNLQAEMEALKAPVKKEEKTEVAISTTEATAIVKGIKREVIVKQVNPNKIVGTVGEAHFEWERKYKLPKVWIPGNKYKTAQVMKKRELIADFIRVALGKKAKAEDKKEVVVSQKTVLKKEAVTPEPEDVLMSDELVNQLYA